MFQVHRLFCCPFNILPRFCSLNDLLLMLKMFCSFLCPLLQLCGNAPSCWVCPDLSQSALPQSPFSYLFPYLSHSTTFKNTLYEFIFIVISSSKMFAMRSSLVYLLVFLFFLINSAQCLQ